MKADGRHGRSCEADEGVNWEVEDDGGMGVSEVSWSAMHEPPKCRLERARKDYGTVGLMLPGRNGPLCTSRARRVTRDIDARQIIEDSPEDAVTRKERRRPCKGKPRNVSTTFTHEAVGEVSPRRWARLECGHAGWLRMPGTREARGQRGKGRPIKMADISVVHCGGSGEARACDDVAGDELDANLTSQARQE